jgi:putative membrane protein
MVNMGIISAGVIFLIIAIFGYIVPVSQDGHTAFQDDEICTSGGANQMGMAYGLTNVMQECQFAKLITFAIFGFGIIGIILVTVGAVVPSKSKEKKDPNSLEILKDRYAKGEITKEEFDKMKEDLS